MNPVARKLSTTIPVDAALLGVLYLAFVQGNLWAYNLSLFAFWFASVGGLLTGFTWEECAKKLDPEREIKYLGYLNSYAWRAYDVATDVMFTTILAGVGEFALATAYAVACMVLKGEMYKWAEQRAIKA